MENLSGIIIINKQAGPTSHDVVDSVRRVINDKKVKVGHAGTLDPFAEGVLIILVGTATKKQTEFMNLKKTYLATLKLGKTTDTYDATGIKSKALSSKLKIISKSKIQEVLEQFTGEIEQTPPAFSAIKIKGKKAYELARKGLKPDLKPRKIKIYEVQLRKYEYPASTRGDSSTRGWPDLEIEVKCSKGTYIRSLANDIGQELGCGAYLEKLTRTAIGKYNLKKGIEINELNPNNLPKKIISANI